jgi:Ethanolamine utilization protein EutJ (predicted chaperonin)
VEVCDSFKACAASEVDVFVMHAPTVSKTFSPNNNVLVGATSQMTIKLTNPNARAITGVSFADNYPAFLVNASDTPFSNTCGGNADLQASAGWLNLTGATIPANGTCSIVVGAIPTKTAAIQNMTGPVTSGNAEAGASATGALHSTNTANHQSAPNVTQVFSPSTIAVGGASTLTITLTNPAGNALAVTDVTFTDQYPPSSYMVNGASATTDCGGTLTAIPGDNKISLSGGVIPVGKSCSVIVEIAGMSPGSDWSHTGPVTSNNSDTAADVPALLTVTDSGLLAAPILEKKFVPDTIAQNATSTLTLTLTNPDPNNAIHDIKLDDFYPAGIRNGGGLPVMHDDCGFTEDVPADLGWAKLDGGTLAGGNTCTVEITVVGTKTSSNQTGVVTSSNALPGSPDSATLTVNGSPPLIVAPTVKPISFAPASIGVGGESAMTITLHNNDIANEITGVQLSVIYPSSSMVNGTGNPVESDDCQFTEDVPTLDKTVVLSGGKIAAGQDCSVVIDVIGTAPSNWTVQTSPVASDNAAIGPGGSGALQIFDSLQKLEAPIVEQTFSPANVLVGGTAKLSIKLTNPPANNSAITGVQLADAYSLPTHIANKPGASTDCGGTLQALPGDTSVALTGGVIPQGGSCTIDVDVIGTSPGSSVSDVGSVTSANADPASAPTAAVTVAGGSLLNPPIVLKQFNPSTVAPGETSQMTISLGNSNGNPIDGAQVNDLYPDGMVNDGPANPVVSDDCGFNEDVPPGETWAKLDGGTVPPGGCSIVIRVVGNATATNDTGPVVSGNAMTGAGNSATLTVNGGGGTTPQAITFTSTPPNNAVVAGPTYHANATSTSGLAVTLTIDAASANVCTINSGTVSLIGAGTCTIDANQGGDATYLPAPEVQQSFDVVSAGGTTPQTITFQSIAPNNAVVAGPTYLATATSTSGLPVVLTIDDASATVCQINNGTVSFIGAGLCTIDANQGGNATFKPAPQAQQSFDVASAGGTTSQTITFESTPPNNAVVAGPTYLAIATSTSGLTVVLTIDDASASVCAISNGTVSFIGAGTCTIDANQGGDATYLPAPAVQQSFTVASAGGTTSQTITFTSTAPVNAMVDGPTYLATATSTSHLPVVLTIDAVSANVCTINNGTVSFVGAGTCTIDANQGGDATYQPAPQKQQSFAVTGGGGGGNTPPVGVGDAIEVAPNGTTQDLVGDANVTDSVLDNDIDPDLGDSLHAVLIDPAQGLTLQSNGTFTYHAPASPGTDAFTYEVCDSANACSDPTTVTITIGNGLDDHAPFAVDDAATVAPGGVATDLIGNPNQPASVLDNDIDPDGDTLTATLLQDVSHGDLVFDSNGTFTYANNGDGSPDDGFIYSVCDSHGACDAGIVTITIADALDDRAPVVVDDAMQSSQNGSTTAVIGDPSDPGSVLFNDEDPDAGDMLTAKKISSLLNGSGTATLDALGGISYQNLDASQTSDQLLYEACDSYGACTGGKVTITIGGTPLGGLPSAGSDAIEVGPGGASQDLVGDANPVDSVLDNDTDPDGDALVASLVSAPAHGSIELDPTGTFTYQNDASDPAGTDVFEYEACNSHGVCAKGMVAITINGNAPTVTCILPNQLNEVGDTISLDLSLLFAPPPNQSLTFSGAGLPSQLSIMGSLLTGTFTTSGTFASTLTATVSAPGGASASENVVFQVLPDGDILLRNGFDPPDDGQQLPCQ